MNNPIKRMIGVAAMVGAALGMSAGMRGQVNAVMTIKPGPYDPFAPSGVRLSGNKSAGAYHYKARGGRPRNASKARRFKKTLRYRFAV